jgi:hypothetical protein
VSTQWSNKTRTSSKLPAALNHAKPAKPHKLQANAFEILSMPLMHCKWVVNVLSRCHLFVQSIATVHANRFGRQALEIERPLSKQTNSDWHKIYTETIGKPKIRSAPQSAKLLPRE